MNQNNSLNIKRVGVTGANGHVGAAVVRLLVARGYSVKVLVYKNTNAIEGVDVETCKGDVKDTESLVSFCNGVDAVIHCAGFIGLAAHQTKTMHRINVEGTKNVVEACLKTNIKKLVHVSSVQAFVPINGNPLNEQASVAHARSDAYSYTKQLGEQVVKQGVAKGLNASIVNPTAILGPYDFNKGAQTKAILKIVNRSIPALMDGGFDWVDVRDVAIGILEAMNHGEQGANYLLSGQWQSFKHIAYAIAKWSGRKPIKLYVPIDWVMVGAFFAEMYAEISKLDPLFTRKALGHIKYGPSKVLHDKASEAFAYKPRAFEDTISDTMHWMNEQGWIKK